MKLYLIASFFIFPLLVKGQLWKFSEVKKISLNRYSGAEKSAPFVCSSGNEIYFVQTFEKKNKGGKFDQDIYYSKRADSINELWSLPKNLNLLNNKFNNGIVGLSQNNNTIYLLGAYGGEKDLDKGISYSKKINGKWQKPIKIHIPDLIIKGNNYGFYMHPNEKILLINYKGPDTYGREDLYISIKQNNLWSSPKHLPKKINTDFYEISPFLSITTDTLYFSSNRNGGSGSADIYYSVKQSADMLKWSKPKNLGKHINSSRFDAYFFIDSKNTMYWSSNRESKYSEIYSCNPIYYPTLSAFIEETKDVSEFGGRDGSVTFSVEGGVKPYNIYNSNILNGTLAKESISESYKLEGCKSGVYSFEIIDSVGQKVVLIDTIKEPPVQELLKINLPEIRHPRNKWTFVQNESIKSLDSLDYLFLLLLKHPTLKIELSSHTDSRGSDHRNQILSNNRAKACYKYLVEQKGIDARRIIPVGKGEKSPLKIKKSDSTELIELNDSYINQFKNNTEKFEDLHQLNRRTEIKILNRNFNPITASPAPDSYLIYEKLP